MDLIPYFEQNSSFDMAGWYYFEEAFTPEEVESIFELASGFPFVAARISGRDGLEEIAQYRRSNIKWLSPTDDANNSIHRTHWLYDRLMNYIEIANREMWGFELYGLTDSIQYTEYDGSEEGFYDWHIDVGRDELSLRKISLVVQLSEPDEYEGGDLQIKTGSGISTPTKVRGSVILFPSYLLHKVTPVTSGLRKSLVLWAGGSSLK